MGIGFVDVLFALVIGQVLDSMDWTHLHHSSVVAGLVSAAFALYSLWDVVSFLIGRQKVYQDLHTSDEDPWTGYNLYRSVPTWVCTILCLGAWLTASHFSHSATHAYMIDAWLAAVAIAFRVVKDTKRTAPTSTGRTSGGGANDSRSR